MQNEKVICNKFSFAYDSNTFGIHDIDLTIQEGEFIVLTGKSGCGKTTLTRCINGLIPDFFEGTITGSCRVCGMDISEHETGDYSSYVGSVFQDPRSQFFTLHVKTEIPFPSENLGTPSPVIQDRFRNTVKQLKGVQTPEINPKEEPMSDNRKYYYLKLKENFYNSETMVILESMQDGLLYSNLLLKMYLMSLKSGGILMLNDHLPHTPQTIATFTRHQVGTVERALKVFVEFGLVEILTDGAYYMADIQLLIGQSSTEGERKKKERMRLKRQKLLPSGGADICPPYSRGDICPPEIRDKRLDIRDKSIENRESESARAYGRYQNVFLTDEELADLQASFPTVWGQYIEKLSEYMASTGKRYQSHAATIRRWAGEDAKKTITPSRNRDYSVKEDETV